MGAQPGTLNSKQIGYAQNGQMILQQEKVLLLLFYDVNSNVNQSYHSYRVLGTTTIGDILVYLQSKVGNYKIAIFINNQEFSIETLHQEIFPYVSQLPERKLGFKINRNEIVRYSDLIKRNQSAQQYSINDNANSMVQEKAPADYEFQQKRAETLNNFHVNNNPQKNNSVRIVGVVSSGQPSNQQNQQEHYATNSEQINIHQQIYVPKDMENKSQPSESQYKNENLRLNLKVKQLEQMQAKLLLENQNLKEEIKGLHDQIKKMQISQNQEQKSQQKSLIIEIPEKQLQLTKGNSCDKTEVHTPLIEIYSCSKKLRISELQQILTEAINKGKPACWNHFQKIPNSICLKAGDVGQVYLNQINTHEINQLCETLQNKKIRVGRCCSQLCQFFCVWDENCRLFNGTENTYCPACLVNSVKKVIVK